VAAKDEHPERYGWWLNELESLGISSNRINELDDLKVISSLAENIKQGQEQHSSYDQRIIELIEAELKKKKGSLDPYYHPNPKASSDSIRPKAVKEDQSLDNFLMT
jgi:hypothetical protein